MVRATTIYVLLFILMSGCVMMSVMKIGHRGAAGHEPENTLRSFKKALDSGVDMVELDVHRSATGQPVILHDSKVDSTTSGTGYVAKKTLDELQRLDAGKGERIPTLREVFDLVGRRAKIDVELKGEGTAQVVADLIERYVWDKGWSYDDFLVSSFNHYELRRFGELNQFVPIGAIMASLPIGLAKYIQKIGADYAILSLDFINKEFVDDAHARGIKVIVYTVDDPDEIARIKALGVDGIVSNYPDRL